MAYIPQHVADVFISYCHDDDFVWIEGFKQKLKSALIRNLRARKEPEIFFDAHDLRAGRVFDEEIRDCLAKTAFFIAMVSRRYNASEYCRHKELAQFLQDHPPSAGRLIQIRLDSSTPLPVDKALAVPFAGAKGIFRSETDEYTDALRRVYEPIVLELDKLYAASKMVFLAWPSDPQLQEERKKLWSQVESSDMRVFPEAVSEYESDVRLREALLECTTSVHFFGSDPQPFDFRQWEMALHLDRPCIIASQSATEARQGPAGSPLPIYLGQGNPTRAIADSIAKIVGIGRREARDPGISLGRTPVFLSCKEDTDALLALRLGKHIKSSGPFEVITPRAERSARFEELKRAKAALVCRPRADSGNWFFRELKDLNGAMVASQMFDLRRALYLPDDNGAADLDVLEEDAILRSTADLDIFLKQLRMQAQGAIS